MSEGWGDIIAIYRSGQPIVGAAFRTNGGIVRTALNTLKYPANSTSVHTKGQTCMGFAWDLRTNLIATHGAAAGHLRATQIVMKSIVADATNQPNAVREVFIADDNDGNLLNGTPNYLDVDPLVDLAISKVVGSPVAAEGDTVTFTITVTNNGPSQATGVTITDQIPAGLTYLSDDGAGSPDSGGRGALCRRRGRGYRGRCGDR